MKFTKTVKIIEPVPRRVPAIELAGRKRLKAKIVGFTLLGVGFFLLMFGVGCIVSAIVVQAAEVERLAEENEALWHRIELLEISEEGREEVEAIEERNMDDLLERVEELEGKWVDADTFEVSDETGKCEGVGFKVGDKIYIPTGPCKKDESPFAINSDDEFDAMANALLAHYEKELEE
jgi:hypothetical protein